MAKFLKKLVMENAGPDDDGKWRLVESLTYQSDIARRYLPNVLVPGLVTVPSGFVTDLASVPRIPIMYWLCGGTANEAAVVHDWLYTSKPVCRLIADGVLLEAMLITGVPKWRAVMMYFGVRLFGGSHWNK